MAVRPSRPVVVAALAVAAFLLHSPRTRADGPSSTRISVPKGPGSIEGLASKDFSPSLASGTSSYAIAIAVPPGAGGHGPALSLAYDSGGGASEVGLGWRIAGIPKIRRRTQEGLPRFDETDAFELEGLGIPSELVATEEGFYRPRYEDGSFVRVARGRRAHEWEARTKAGAILRFGGEGCVEAEGEKVTASLLREQRDRHGHAVSYEWDTSGGWALLQRVVWNDFDDAARNEVVFEYEERPDVHRLFSSGMKRELGKRVRTVHVHHGAKLVRRYELAYGEGLHPSLASITLVGSDGESTLPAARFEYTQARLQVTAGQLVTMKRPPGASPAEDDAALVDLNGDGLTDLLIRTAGTYHSYLNQDGITWRTPRTWLADESPSASLGQRGVQLADVDADGAADLVVKSGTDAFRYFPAGVDRFATAIPISPVPSFTFEDPDVRLADLDGDRRTDVIMTTPAGVAVGLRTATGWDELEILGRVDERAAVRFSDGRTHLCDVNGDRVQDLCILRSQSLVYYLGRGRGRFEVGVAARGVPEFEAESPFVLEDLNGDGWVDLVRPGVNELSYALAVAEGAFGEVHVIEGTPARGPRTTVHFADMNGSGTTDVVWIDVTGDDAAAWRYLELFPEGKAGLLRRIDNGLGKVQTIEYAPAATDAAAARANGNPWKTRMNVAMAVVRRVSVDSSLGDPVIASEYSYRDGAYDARERGFAGFGSAIERAIGDEWTPTLLTELTFDPGLESRVLRGVPLRKETRDEHGFVFGRERYTYETRRIGSVELAVKVAEEVEHVEGSSPRVTRTEYEVDDHGNAVVERRWGDVAVDGDETFVRRTFAESEAEWLLGFVATETLISGGDERVSETRKYYDGGAFEGLPLGQVSRGNVSREEAWVGPGAHDFELVIATRYDADGHPVETRDARGGGHVFEWASDRTSIRSEGVKLEGGRALVEQAAVDAAFGSLTRITEYNGQTTFFEYDPFGRLTKVVRPGDTDALPTARYTYVAAAPLSRIVTELRVDSGADAVERSETLQDGLGRTRGTVTTDEASTLLAGVNLYDARGNARRALLPRFVTLRRGLLVLLQEEVPRGTNTWRDAAGRPLRVRSPSGTESRTEYAPLESRHWDGGQTDPRSPYEQTPTTTRRDGLGRVVRHEQTLDGKALAAFYTYDAAGALASRTDPEGATARYRYDGRGRRVALDDPDHGRHRFSYDATGNLIAHEHPDGKTARFTYDLAGRALTQDGDGDGEPESTRYWDEDASGHRDPRFQGKLVEVVDESGGARHTFDERGRIVRTELRIGDAVYTVGSAFDAQDRERTHVYPDGSSIDVHRNVRGQISGYGRALFFEYAEDGLETVRRFSTGVRAEGEYDEDRRRRALRVLDARGGIIEHLRWRYDAASNLIATEDRRAGVTEADDRTERYEYDNLYRLARVTGTWGTTSYRYSPSGSLLARDSTVARQSIRSIDYGKRPHAPTAFDGVTVEYDARGRMRRDGERTYEWSDTDELLRVDVASGAGERNVYDAEGKRRIRVERAADGRETTTHFIDAWSEVRDGKLTRYIVHGGQRIVRLASATGAATVATGVLAAVLSTGLSFILPLLLLIVLVTWRPSRVRTLAGVLVTAFLLAGSLSSCAGGDHGTPGPGAVTELAGEDTLLTTDLLGSLLGETTASGHPSSHFSAYPYGATRYDTSRESHKYAATPRDQGVGLDAMGARYYAPERGLFTSPDPVGLSHPERLVTEDFAAANPYAYAKDSPLVAADRDGHFWHVAIGAGIGALVGGGIEAARQYYTTGKISEPGRIVSAAMGGAVSGALVAACPAAGLGATLGVNAAAGAADGVTRRIVESGGKSAGTVGEAVIDAGISAATAGVLKGGGALVKAGVKRAGGGGSGLRGAAVPALPPAPSPRKIDAAWSASRYRHGGLMTGMEHISYRHSAGSAFESVSHFAEGTKARDIVTYVDDALRHGTVTPTGNNAFKVEFDLGRAIGTDAAGAPASSIRVFVRDGTIQTAFPF